MSIFLGRHFASFQILLIHYVLNSEEAEELTMLWIEIQSHHDQCIKCLQA